MTVRSFKNPILNREQKQRLRYLYKRDNYHGFLALFENLLWISAAIAISLLSNYWAYALSALIIGARQRALATLLHEAAHGTLFQAKWLNQVAGRLSGWPILQTFNSYRISHVLNHHPKIGSAQRDPDFAYMKEAGVYQEQTRVQFIARFLCTPLLGMLTPRYIGYLIKHRLIETSRDVNGRLELLAVLSLHSLGLTLAWVDGVLLEYMTFWWFPFLLVHPVIGWFCELAEHYPMMDDTQDTTVFYSRNRHSSRLEQLFFGMHCEYLHLTHHLLPGIPYWNLHKANAVLREDVAYRVWDDTWGGIFSTTRNDQISLVNYILNYRQFAVQLTCPVFQQEI